MLHSHTVNKKWVEGINTKYIDTWPLHKAFNNRVCY